MQEPPLLRAPEKSLRTRGEHATDHQLHSREKGEVEQRCNTRVRCVQQQRDANASRGCETMRRAVVKITKMNFL